MKQYKFITGPDDSQFCARITDLLNDGWSLYGSPALTYNGNRCIAGQAVVKEIRQKKTSVKAKKQSKVF